MTGQIAYWVLAVVTLAGAATVVLSRDIARMVLGLGAFLLGVAAWFLYFTHVFLAAAQVFVYVGGVLILVLFALMLVHRTEAGRPELESRHGLDSALVALGVFVLLVQSLRGVWGGMTALSERGAGEVGSLSSLLLGDYLVHFEAAGLLLLVALVAAIVILGGDRE